MTVTILILSALTMATGASFGGVAYENLVLTTNEWFSATVGASSITTSTDSYWTTPTDYAWAYETVDSKACAEINTELNAPVTLTSSTVNSATGLAMMTFDLIASTVPNGVAVTAPDGKSPAYGFAIKADADGNRNFYAYIGSSWVKLTGTPPPEENKAYTLTVIEDARSDFGKVQFRVKIGEAAEVILAQDGTPATTWFDAGDRKTAKNTVNVDLYGTGYFHLIDGDTQTVTAAEIIPTDGKKVVVTPAVEEAFENAVKGGGKTVAELMTTNLKESGIAGAPNSSSLQVRDAYALGLVTVENSALKVKDDGVIVMKKKEQTEEVHSDSIPLALNITPPTGAATVTFSLLGRDSDSDAWTTVQSGKAAAELSIPLAGTVYNYYKVQANITYAN